jgi:hypothetical protein
MLVVCLLGCPLLAASYCLYQGLVWQANWVLLEPSMINDRSPMPGAGVKPIGKTIIPSLRIDTPRLLYFAHAINHRE